MENHRHAAGHRQDRKLSPGVFVVNDPVLRQLPPAMLFPNEDVLVAHAIFGPNRPAGFIGAMGMLDCIWRAPLCFFSRVAGGKGGGTEQESEEGMLEHARELHSGGLRGLWSVTPALTPPGL